MYPLQVPPVPFNFHLSETGQLCQYVKIFITFEK